MESPNHNEVQEIRGCKFSAEELDGRKLLLHDTGPFGSGEDRMWESDMKAWHLTPQSFGIRIAYKAGAGHPKALIVRFLSEENANHLHRLAEEEDADFFLKGDLGLLYTHHLVAPPQ